MRIPFGRKIVTYLLLIAAAFLVFTPTMMAVVMSFMTNQDIMTGSLPSAFSLDNYRRAFEQFPLLHYVINSFLVSIAIMIGQLILASLAAYAFVF